MHNLKEEDITRIVTNLVNQAQTLSQLGEISLILRLLNDNPDSDKKKIALAQEVIANYLNRTLTTAISPPKPIIDKNIITSEEWGRLYHDYPKVGLIQSMKSDIIFEFLTARNTWTELTQFPKLNIRPSMITISNPDYVFLEIHTTIRNENDKMEPIYSFWCISCREWTHTSQKNSTYTKLRFPVLCSRCTTQICRVSHFPALETLTTSDTPQKGVS